MPNNRKNNKPNSLTMCVMKPAMCHTVEEVPAITNDLLFNTIGDFYAMVPLNGNLVACIDDNGKVSGKPTTVFTERGPLAGTVVFVNAKMQGDDMQMSRLTLKQLDRIERYPRPSGAFLDLEQRALKNPDIPSTFMQTSRDVGSSWHCTIVLGLSDVLWELWKNACKGVQTMLRLIASTDEELAQALKQQSEDIMDERQIAARSIFER